MLLIYVKNKLIFVGEKNKSGKSCKKGKFFKNDKYYCKIC